MIFHIVWFSPQIFRLLYIFGIAWLTSNGQFCRQHISISSTSAGAARLPRAEGAGEEVFVDAERWSAQTRMESRESVGMKSFWRPRE